MKEYLNLIDRSTQGSRYDVTPVIKNIHAFSALLDDLLNLCQGIQYDVIAAIDALGFILGAGIAVKAKKPLVPIRKGGKLPVEVNEAEFIDYSGKQKSLEIRKDAFTPSERVLLVDEWIETGSQVKTAINLIEREGAQVVGIVTINVDDSAEIRSLSKMYPIMAASRNIL